MCNESQDPRMSGLHAGHLKRLQAAMPENSSLIGDVYHGLVKSLNPHLPVLAAILALVDTVRGGDFGVLGKNRLARLPLSIIGVDKVRYRTPLVEDLHESILSFRMSELAVENLRAALKPHGFCVLFLCSCGVVMGRCEDVRKYYGSEAHYRMDRLRSAVDAEGNPVVDIATFDDIQVPTMDLHHSGAEERLFNLVEEIINTATGGRANYPWIQDELDAFIGFASESNLEMVA